MDCGHTLFFSPPVPAVGDDIYCHHHVSSQKVVRVLAEYRARCTECNYSRRYGQAKLTAATKATTHALAKNHTVALMLGNSVVTLVNEHDQPELVGTEDPPF